MKPFTKQKLLCLSIVQCVLWGALTVKLSQGAADEPPYLNRGMKFLDQKNYKQALREYDLAIKEHPDDRNGYDARACAYSMLRKFKLAVADENKSIALKPGYLGYLNRGVALMELERYDDAVQDFLKALEITPGDPDVYSNIGVTRYRQKKYKEALEALRKAKEVYIADDGKKSEITNLDNMIREIENHEDLKPIH